MSGDDWYHCNKCGGIGCSRRRSELEAMGMFRDGWVHDVICPYSMEMTAFKWETWQGDERMTEETHKTKWILPDLTEEEKAEIEEGIRKVLADNPDTIPKIDVPSLREKGDPVVLELGWEECSDLSHLKALIRMAYRFEDDPETLSHIRAISKKLVEDERMTDNDHGIKIHNTSDRMPVREDD